MWGWRIGDHSTEVGQQSNQEVRCGTFDVRVKMRQFASFLPIKELGDASPMIRSVTDYPISRKRDPPPISPKEFHGISQHIYGTDNFIHFIWAGNSDSYHGKTTRRVSLFFVRKELLELLRKVDVDPHSCLYGAYIAMHPVKIRKTSKPGVCWPQWSGRFTYICLWWD